MKAILLGFRKILLDDEDYPRLVGRKIYLNKTGRIITLWEYSGSVSIGRFILGYDGPLTVDHRDRDIYNNQKSNLRLATYSQQQANQPPENGKKYKGAYPLPYETSVKPFFAMICFKRKQRRLGRFSTLEAAARAYDRAAFEIHGEFAYLNFPEEILCQR